MKPKANSNLGRILNEHETEILNDWTNLQRGAVTRRSDLINDADLHRQSKEFLSAFRQCVDSGNVDDIHASNWAAVRDILADIARNRVRMGFSPSETATF